MSNVETKSTQDAFGRKLAALAKENKQIVALDGDGGHSTQLSFVEEEVPDALLHMGMGAQNMISVAAGLATTGMIPWACSFTSVITRRAYDQIVGSVDQPRLNVKLVGSNSGLRTGLTDLVEDIGLLTTLPHMVVLSPGDARETVHMMDAMVAYDGPVYIRLSNDEMLEDLPETDESFEIGKSRTLHEGKRVACVSTGSMSPRAFKAVSSLSEDGIDVTHVHFPTIKPLDAERITELAKTHDHLITVEDHYTASGLGSLVSEVTSRTSPVWMTRIGIDNPYTESEKDADLLAVHGLTSTQLKEQIKQIYEWK